MNRILFLPLNRAMSYFILRAVAKGHVPFWSRWRIGIPEGREGKYWKKDFFGTPMEESRRHKYYDEWSLYWHRYFKRWRITHVVANVESCIPVLAAMDVARVWDLSTSYVAHGEGEIYGLEGNARWLEGNLYDHFYARNLYTANYTRNLPGVRMDVRRFSRDRVSMGKFKKTYIPGKKRILCAPNYTGAVDGTDSTKISTADYGLRCEYGKEFIREFVRSGHEVWWNQNPAQDKGPNPILKHLEASDRAGEICWTRGNARRLLRKVDCAVTDVGSAFFLEAIAAGKPVLCLYHGPTTPVFKPETKLLFGGCLESFKSHGELRGKLRQFLLEKEMRRYVPWRYVRQESGARNDELVWEQ